MSQELLFKDRELIADLHLKGGLEKPDLFQKVELCYFLPTLTQKSKVVLKFGISNNKHFTEKPVSLRFNHMGELVNLIRVLNAAMVKLGKQQGDITPDNFEYLINREVKFIDKTFRGEK